MLAAQHPEALAYLRAHGPPAAACGGRFTDAELMRYAVAAGWLAAAPGSPASHKALHQAAQAARRTEAWLGEHRFATPEEAAAVARLARWAPDEAGRPVLELLVGRASRERSGKRAAQEYGNVIVSLVQGALEGGRLRDTPEAGPQDLVVRVDAAGATVLSSARILPVVRHVALSMNQHYPGRLHRMELHHLPSFAVWLVSAVRQLMHATTRDKVVVVDASGAVTKA